MRMTLASLGALTLTALLFTACDKDQVGGTTPPEDLSMTQPDLSTDVADMAVGAPDLTTPADLAVTPVTPTEFTVVRIGMGTAALTNDATATFLERRKITDGSLVGVALALPTAVSGANKQLTLSGLASVEGQLTRSADGKYLIIAGYAAAVGSPNVSSSASATVNRVIGRIDAAGNINTATASTGFTAAGMRGAASTDGNMLWVSSDSGIGYTTLGSTAVPTLINITNVRGIGIFGSGNGVQLYASSVSNPNQGLNAVGTGTPTAANTTVTRLTGFTMANSPASVGFVAFDRDGNGTVDQMYVADDTLGAGGGIQRWKLNGAAWMLEGTVGTGANAGARYVTGLVTGTTATLLVTTAEGGGVNPRILQLTDAGGATSAVTTKMLATAAGNTTYRGIALAPNP
jgi:hypothetical protein